VIYIFDTCAWIGAWQEIYPIDRFPDLWRKFSDMIRAGKIHSVQKVREEIHSRVSLPVKKDMEAISSSQKMVYWLDSHQNLYLPSSQREENLASEIINSVDGKKLVTRKRKDPADPYVIARAEIQGWTVVTQEGVGGNGIPAVCKKRGVKCVNLIGFFREQEWEFHLR